jgi:TatD DNase family protein
MLIDTHAHVNFNAYKDDADEVLKKSLAGGVFVVNVGSQYSTSKRAVEMAHKYEGVYAAVGLHPIQLKARTIEYQDNYELTPEEINPALSDDTKKINSNKNLYLNGIQKIVDSNGKCWIKTTGEEFDYVKYLELAKDEKVIAIGEVGLDYHHFDPPRVDERFPRVEAGEGDNISELKEKQKEILLQFIKLANEVEKPLMIHCWDAYDDLYEILQNNPVKKLGVVHSFVGGYKTAKKFIELGYKIGLNGVITYGISYDRLIREIDLKDIVLETDCPYLTPVPKKGERNEPVYVKLVAEKIAIVREISVEEVAEWTTKNAKLLFNI